MVNLIKYEFRKSWIIKAIILVFTAVFELMFIGGTIFNNEDFLGMGIAFLSLTTICALFIIGVYGIFRLHKDLTTKQSYMLFMTPNSSYKILGAKLIENAGSILVAGVFYILLAIVDFTFLMAANGEIREGIELLNQILGAHYSVDTYGFVMVSLNIIVIWIFTIVVGYLAVIISASILSGRKFSGVISFIIFLIINGVVQKIHGIILELVGFDTFGFSTGKTVLGLVFDIVFAIIVYFAAAWIMDNKLSV